MTKISNQQVYKPDTDIVGKDYIVGTDSDQAKKTVNFRIEDIGSHFNSINGVRNFDFYFYEHQSVNPKPADGCFYANDNEQDPNNITEFYFSKITQLGKDVTQFFESIEAENPFDLVIAQKVGINSVLFFQIDNVEVFNGYFKLNVSEVFFPEGNGIEYILSYAIFNLKPIGNTSGNTNLGYIPSPTQGTVTSSTGTNAVIPLTDVTNAGLFSPAEKTKLENIEDTYVPYTGATTNVDLGNNQIKVDQLEFDQTPVGTFGVGKVRWNDIDGTTERRLKGNNVTLQDGQEIVKRVVNKTGADLLESEYKVVRLRSVSEGGAQGQRSAVVLAQADTSLHSKALIGVVTENITDNQEGFITLIGEVRNINTTGSLQSETWVDGDQLFLSQTVPGGLTNVVPTSPNYSIPIATVDHAHATQGKISVYTESRLSLDTTLSDDNDTAPSVTAVKTYVDNGLDTKQDTLVSGTNIKTYYSASILGSGDLANQKTISGNTTLDNTYNGAIVKVKATAAITIPSGLATNFNCVFDVWTGATATFSVSGTTIDSSIGTTLTSGKMATLYQDAGTNDFRLRGELS